MLCIPVIAIYASFGDGSVGVLTAITIILRCRIVIIAYDSQKFWNWKFSSIKSQLLYFVGNSNNSSVYPLVIAAQPTEPNQFALGLTDGAVRVLEPLESEGKWGTLPPFDNGAGPSIAAGQGSSDQLTSVHMAHLHCPCFLTTNKSACHRCFSNVG
ncbi:hypothetical protein IFM89_015284 [Coptis chinensis]|uniref:Uncharacterized protein n=1 Tax=Coptis chinensis TaxID=261450 RepID=A0A835M908_9MAGN|nr:hypothetical protein IFM89_015284 [Coptis chinensis]